MGPLEKLPLGTLVSLTEPPLDTAEVDAARNVGRCHRRTEATAPLLVVARGAVRSDKQMLSNALAFNVASRFDQRAWRSAPRRRGCRGKYSCQWNDKWRMLRQHRGDCMLRHHSCSCRGAWRCCCDAESRRSRCSEHHRRTSYAQSPLVRLYCQVPLSFLPMTRAFLGCWNSYCARQCGCRRRRANRNPHNVTAFP